jgi:hypothetical protein
MDIFAIIEQILTFILGLISIIFSPQINPPNKYNGTCFEGFVGENCEIGNYKFIHIQQKMNKN